MSLKLRPMRTVITMIVCLLFIGCKDDARNKHIIPPTEISIPVARLEKDLFESENEDEVHIFLDEHPDLANIFLDGHQYPSTEVLANKIATLIKNPSIDTLYRESLEAYKDFESVQSDLESAFGRLKTLFPSTKTPRVETIVTGLYNDLFISDSLIIIGLDFFIGENATFKPQDVPQYILKRYNKEHLAGVIVKFMAGQHVDRGRESSLISEMIDFGKTYYLASRLLPNTPDSILLGYTPEEMTLIYDNEAIIWATLLENEALYETSQMTKRRFLGERPNVYEIDQKCPGRVGAWVGWRIVESFMEKNDVTIKELISATNNDQLFMQSGYKPQSR
ncbi:MAG: hypothetical protein RIC35_03465 [Marinoscillum sp.]